jgi:hypothetical protein
MKYLKFSLSAITICLFVACSDSSCFKCTNENGLPQELELCEDSDINYTDQNGNVLEYSEYRTYFESVGYDCD